MKKLIFTLAMSLYITSIWAQKTKLKKDMQAIKFAKTITQKDLSRHLHIVASDDMEGRRTGTPGQKKAAKYIAAHFKKLGLTPPVKNGSSRSYFQPFALKSTKWKEVYVEVAGQKYEFLKDVFALGVSAMQAPITSQVVFAGNGSREEIKKAGVKNKGVVYFAESHADAMKKGKVAKKLGAKALFVLRAKTNNEYADLVNFNSYYVKRWVGPKLSKKTIKSDLVFYVSPRLAAKMLNAQEDVLVKNELVSGTKGQSVKALATQEEKITLASENVLGFLEGSSKKDEILVISAHYDHIGKYGNQINNGADDDGSGTVAVLELAEAFVKAKKAGKGPKRSILFITVAGEEMGLYGSRFYTDIDPVFPLKNTVADLNIDMIGRIDDIYKTDPNYIYLIGSDKLSTELHQLSEEANKQYINLKLDYKYNDKNDPNRFYYRSDHYNFAKNRIPVIFYFNGTHADYHRPTDTVDKIHFAKMEKITRLIFHTAWKVANRSKRIVVDK